MIQSPLFWLALLLLPPLVWALPLPRRAPLIALGSALVLAAEAPLTTALLSAGVTLGAWLWPRLPRWAPALIIALLAVGLAGAKLATGGHLVEDSPLVPIGLSFFTFRLIHYAAERSRGALPAHRPIDALAWILLFPLFTAGPIARFTEPGGAPLLALEARPKAAALAAAGTRVATGLIKRLVLAELVWEVALKEQGPDVILDALPVLSAAELWAWALASFARLYLDFSGYSDIAIGAAGLLGVRVEENFRWPMLAQTPAELWRRWHISLGAWCQAYLYLPLLGLSRSPTLATVLTFVLMGLWHGMSGPWLIWGLLHGLAVAAVGARDRYRRRHRLPLRQRADWLGAPLTWAFAAAAHAAASMHGVGGADDALRLLAHLFGWRLGAPAEPG